MSLDLILGLVGGALVALFGGVGWSQIRKHGEERAERRHAEEERDAAIRDAEVANRAPLSGPESVDALRRLRDD